MLNEINQFVSIGIPTGGRQKKLIRLLNSIKCSSIHPYNLIICDTSINGSSKILDTVQLTGRNILYIRGNASNAAMARNTIIRHCITQYLAFVDDDCIVDPKWLECGLSAIQRHKAIVVLGNSLLLNKNSLIAQAQYIRDSFWLKKKIGNDHFFDYSSFDSKNMIINCHKFLTMGFRFDEEFTYGWYDLSDADLGMQMKTKQVPVYYEKSMKLFHEEANTLRTFTKRAFGRGVLAYRLKVKWNLAYEYVFEPEVGVLRWLLRLKNIPREYREYFREYSYSFNKKLFILALIKLYERVFLNGYAYAKKTQLS
jgi:glycosyltransferase involved in cell wall biosynthesis